MHHSVQKRIEACAQLRVPRAASPRPRAHDDVHRGQLALAQPERLARDPADAVALDRAPRDLHPDGEAQPRRGPAVRADGETEVPVAEAAACGIARVEIDLPAQPALRGKSQARGLAAAIIGQLSPYGMSLLRPFARRRARTLRPFAVAIRARNPCVRLRRTLLG